MLKILFSLCLDDGSCNHLLCCDFEQMSRMDNRAREHHNSLCRLLRNEVSEPDIQTKSDCSICVENLEEQNIQLYCSHTNCITRWTEEPATWPLCWEPINWLNKHIFNMEHYGQMSITVPNTLEVGINIAE